MLRKFTIIVVVLCCSATMVMSQSVMVKPVGFSPRQAAKDTEDIVDRAYNGLLNVGVETQMYLAGHVKDSSLVSPIWSILSAPTNSIADIATTEDFDTSTQIAVFTPDLVGTYVVEFADIGTADTVTINAGTYVGIQGGFCNGCHHGPTHDEWEETGHYSLFEEMMDGGSNHYASYCVPCHTTGYDANADNGGFDDRGFVFPDSTDLVNNYGSLDGHLFNGVWDQLFGFYPDAMKLARIQCESCHGPGSAHMGATGDSKMVSTLDAANCAICHDSGTHHAFPDQWRTSGHANPPVYRTGTWRSSCARCHTGTAFIQYVEGETVEGGPTNPFTCAVCHEPHSVENEHQLRTMDATPLENGHVITEGGTGKICMNCHMSRDNALTDTEPEDASSHYGPHYMPQADMLAGTNVVTFGVKLPSSPHLADIENSCAGCHMAGDHVADEAGNIIHVGGHSFAMTDEAGHENVHACEPCHGDVGHSFHEKKFYVNGNADHDGDGVENGLQEEVHGLMDILAALLPHHPDSAGYDAHDAPDTTWTRTEMKAAFNFEMVYYDHSYGIHNPAFTVALLRVSIQAMLNNAIEGDIIAIEDVPNDQGKKVRIVWDKFVDDGVVALDPVERYLVKRLGHDGVWTGVGAHPADHSGRYALVVPTLFDVVGTDTAWTDLKVVAITRSGRIHESLPAAGFSIDNLVPHAPGDLVALTFEKDVELSWMAPADPDVNYYQIFRSTTASFEANKATLISTTTNLEYLDATLEPGTYFYKVRAVDFSENLGELSPIIEAEIATSVAGQDNGLPTKYALRQNYPNPFNPITNINFDLVKTGHVTLEVYNLLGQKVATLVDKSMMAGTYSVSFNGLGLSTGEYIYRIDISSDEGIQYQSMSKMVLMK